MINHSWSRRRALFIILPSGLITKVIVSLFHAIDSNVRCVARETASGWRMWTPTCPCPRPATTVTPIRGQVWTAVAAACLEAEAYQWAPETALPSPPWSAPLNSPRMVRASIGSDMCGLVEAQKIKQARNWKQRGCLKLNLTCQKPLINTFFRQRNKAKPRQWIISWLWRWQRSDSLLPMEVSSGLRI